MDGRIPPDLRPVRARDRRRARRVGGRGGRLSRPLAAGLALAGFALAGLALAACGAPGPGPWVEADGVRWRELRPRGSTGFRPLDASSLGVTFRYEVEEEARLRNRVLAEGQGVAIGDVDGDERPDLFFAGFGGASALYRNLGGWRFADVTAAAGLALEDAMARGAVFADLDGDSDLDLVVTVHGGRNRIFLGDGMGRFDELEDAGLTGDRASTTATLADVDRDGDLDLYIANYKTRQVDDLHPPGALDINRLRRGEDGGLFIPPELRELYAEHYRVEFDGRFVRRFELGEPDEFYMGLGDGRFAAAALTGAPPGSAPTAAGEVRDWGLAARFSDWDADGDPDLYVANDFNSPDGIWINRGDGSFEAAPAEAIRTTSLSSMAVAVGDLDRDGDLDLLTTDMLARDPAARLTRTASFEAAPEPPGETGSRVQVNRNTVQLNRGDGTFAEAAWELGLAASDWTWGALVIDADLDGWDDLLVTTGHAWDQLDGDANARIAAIPGLPAEQALRMFPPLPQRNLAFRGGAGRFTDVSDRWRWGEEPDISHGLAAGDLDGDGDLDVVVTRLGAPPLAYRNESGAPRVLVRLRGPEGNTRGIGARVGLEGHDAGVQLREITAGGAYLSSSEPAASFAAVLDADLTLTVDWPDGRRTRLEGIVANREYVIDISTAAGAPGAGAPDPAAPHFEDVSDLLGHRHVESVFDDRARQPLLPYSLDRPGPGVSWIDVEADGDADLVVGSGRGGSPVLMRNVGDGFAAPRALTVALEYDATAVLPHEMGGGGAALLIGLSAYEAGTPADAAAVPAVIAAPLGASAPAPPLIDPASFATGQPPVATGPLAQADIDGDGDLDLFAGGRVAPAAWPAPVDSRLLVNDGGVLRADAERSRAFARLGLVSGAVFTDIDLDGDPDLALALEWGSVRVFRNDGGRFTDASDALGFSRLTGRWNGITAGDFDEDGRPDLVATGWGSNLEVPAAYSLLYGDMNRDGVVDVVEARPESGVWRPIRSRDALAVPGGISSLLRVTYERFGSAPLTELIGGLDPAARLDVNELRHTVWLNRASGFESAPLPAPAQRAPAFGVAAGDLDGDGHEDLVLAQNFYAGRSGVPRYDAGRALWLRGDGEGGFEPVPGHLSGITVYGDARAVALADYDRDGRVDVAFGVNGEETRLYRNAGAAPGLRVTLEGIPGNRRAIGARLRLEYGDGTLGPVREVRSGEGYLARHESAQTLGVAPDPRTPPRTLHIVWPGGEQTSVAVPPGARELRVPAPGDAPVR
ncbi:FG-GAP-like repeat-containing protein [Candidatus Palauibacter sp.]|uniref:FG-GAP-like repeat-containing protein n=1 Tax=Candidatus Palauibacter sp. TaxID=3101350 RepID=UPI003B51CA2C